MEKEFTIRHAGMADVAALSMLHVVTFNETHGSFNSPVFETRRWQWENLFAKKDDSWFCLVVEESTDGLVGFAKGQPYSHKEHSEFKGELNKIYLLRKYQGIGLGRKLIGEVAREFVQRGIMSMLLFGDASNRSNGFYEAMGAERLYTGSGDFHGGYGWCDLGKVV